MKQIHNKNKINNNISGVILTSFDLQCWQNSVIRDI